MATALTQIEVQEVSLVDRGANRKKFALRKAQDKDAMPVEAASEVLKACLNTPLENEDAIDVRLSKAGLDKQVAGMFKGLLRLLAANHDRLNKDHFKLIEELAGYADSAGDDAEKSLTAKRDTSTKDASPVEKSSETKAAIPEPIQKQLTEQREALAKMSERNVELEKALSVERENRVLRECTEKAAREFSMLGGKEAVGQALKKLQEAKLLDEVEPLLKAAQEKAARSELFKEQSRSVRTTLSAGGRDAIDKAARELCAKDPKLSLAKATDIIIQQNHVGEA